MTGGHCEHGWTDEQCEICAALARTEKELSEWRDIAIQRRDELDALKKWADGSLTALQRELDNERAREIHTCHDNCQRPMCVLRRERDAAQMDAARWRYTQRPGYFVCGPYRVDGDWCGYAVGIQPTPKTSLHKCVQGRGNTLAEAIDNALEEPNDE